MHRKRAKAVRIAFGLTVLAALGCSWPARALIGDQMGLSPFWDWKTLETEHFRVTFPAELEATAQKGANFLEEAHAVLSPKLYWQPWHKTQILVIDNADLANGLTSPQFRLGLILWVTPPDPWFSTAYYDDWLRLLAFHEYTHFLNMDNVQDFYVPLRYLTGDVLLPNASWPTWMLEGLAVYEETRFTHGGRGRSPLYEMFVRTAADESVLDSSSFYKIDQFNGSTPYNPAGETYYLFGYQLMNQLARTPSFGGRTADGMGELHGSEDALGLMSLRSAARVPYFINGNVESIIGKSWYSLWDDWVVESRKRAAEQLSKIRSQPVSRVVPLTPAEGITTLGPAPSPDGRWLAYTQDSPDRRSGLYLLDLKTGQNRRLADKDAGATEAFTPDSRAIVYSSVERYHTYYQWSDLEAYDVDEGRQYSLTNGLRARDPDVSPDGKWLTFTLSLNETTILALAPLERGSNGRLAVGTVMPFPSTAAKYDRVSAPRFARDGKRVIYSVHRNGKLGEELMSWDIETSSATVLVDNGKFNRFPAPAADGSIYFVSDLTGVENLFRLPAASLPGAAPELASNLVSGLTTPSLGPAGEIYAAYYASKGWSIARIEPLRQAIATSDVTIAPPPAPQTDEESSDHSKAEHHEVKNYSAWPSILPRQWLIIPEIYPGGLYVQEDVEGFDAVDRHDYLAGLGYNTQIPKVDWSLIYANRMLGPTLSLFAADHTTRFSINDQGVTDYTRKREYAVELSYLLQWTYSSLQPAVSVGGQRVYNYYRGYDPTREDLVNFSPSVTTADLSFAYSNAESARLSVSQEEGVSVVGGVRLYDDPTSNQDIYKGVIKGASFLRIGNHGVLSPSIKAVWTSGFDYNYGSADAVVQGRTPGLVPTSLSAIFDPLGMRGYPNALFFSRSATVTGVDFRMPILQIFRGWGTNPVFLDNVYVFGFGEATYFPSAPSVPVLPAVGGGLTLKTEVFLHIPVSVTGECDQGLQSDFGGKTDLFVSLNIGALQF